MLIQILTALVGGSDRIEVILEFLVRLIQQGEVVFVLLHDMPPTQLM